MKRWIVRLGVLMVLDFVAPSEAAVYGVTQLTHNGTSNAYPHISGANVAWSGQLGSDPNNQQIFLYNGTTTTQLTNSGLYNTVGGVSASNVAWAGGGVVSTFTMEPARNNSLTTT